jgi:ribonuclease BN (tRNA processing enzyme)
VLVDCGAGTLPGLARAELPWGEIDHLLISHFHADHIGEIPSLIFALRHGLEVPRTTPLDIWGPAGTRRVFDALANAFGPWVIDPGFPVSIHEIRPEGPAQVGGLLVHSASTPHTNESLALRLETDDATLGYTGDTGPSEDLAEFFRGVDLLLAECSLPDELVADNHLSPSRLARLALGAGIDRIAVTHVYPQLQRLDVPGLIRSSGFDGEIVMAYDGLRLLV